MTQTSKIPFGYTHPLFYKKSVTHPKHCNTPNDWGVIGILQSLVGRRDIPSLRRLVNRDMTNGGTPRWHNVRGVAWVLVEGLEGNVKRFLKKQYPEL